MTESATNESFWRTHRRPLTLVAALVAALGWGWLYQVILSALPFLFLSVIACVVSALGTGVVTGLAVRLGRIRPAWAALGFGVGVAAVTIAAGHTTEWMWAGVRAGTDLDPLQYVGLRERTGWDARQDSLAAANLGTITGWAVWLVWGMEFMAFAASAGAFAWRCGRAASCEPCNLWADTALFESAVQRPDDGMVRRVAKATRFEDLLPVVTPHSPPGAVGTALLYRVEGCPECRRTRFVTVAFVKLDRDWLGRPERHERVLQRRVAISDDQVRTLRDGLPHTSEVTHVADRLSKAA